MTVQKTYIKNKYTGDGSNTLFPITFEWPKDHPEFIQVWVKGSEGKMVQTNNFALRLQANTEKWNVVYPINGAPLAAGAVIVVARELPLQQILNLVNQGPYFAEDIEVTFDEVVMMIQQINEKVGRSFKVGVDIDGETSFDATIPVPAEDDDNVYGIVVSKSGIKLGADLNAIKAQTQAIYEAAVRDTGAIKNATDVIKTQTQTIYNNTVGIKNQTQAIHDQTVRDANTIKEATNAIKSQTQIIYNNTVGIKNQTQAIHDQTVRDANAIKDATNAIKSQTQTIYDNAVRDTNANKDLSRKWAESPISPDGSINSKSSKSWAELSKNDALEAARQAQYCTAMANQSSVYDSTKTYNPTDVVMMPDGQTYRCIAESTGENPQESNKWVIVTSVVSVTFEPDENGDLMPIMHPKSSAQFDIDDDGDIMPAL